VSDDLHSPTTAAPTPGTEAAAPQAAPPTLGAEAAAPQTAPPTTADRIRDAAPEPVANAAESAISAAASARQTLAGAWSGEQPAERPEILAGAAFAGGLIAALILKRLGR
jgi:hypothetical protein